MSEREKEPIDQISRTPSKLAASKLPAIADRSNDVSAPSSSSAPAMARPSPSPEKRT